MEKTTTSKTTCKRKSTTKNNSEVKTAKKCTKKQTVSVEVTKNRNILFVGSECAPFMATGGLADVLGSLPNALAKNNSVSVIMPLYSNINQEHRAKFEFVTSFYVSLSWRHQYCGIFKYVYNGVTYYFIDNEYYFKREGNIYGFYDDGERFAFFSKAVVDAIKVLGLKPNVVHCNDWQSAATVIYLKTLYYSDSYYQDIKTVFTIHNIEYQGKFDPYCIGDLFGFNQESESMITFDGCLNLMKGAIEYSDIVSTVSPTYAEEIKTAYYAHGLDGIICRNAQKVYGILNGIDIDYYNPETDKYIFKNYTPSDISGKAVCKENLQKMLNLPVREDVPVIAIISRLVSHKGLDLVKAVIESLLATDVQVVILGKGDASYENYFSSVASNYQGKCACVIAYNQDLSRKIYSGADIFLMPSKSEPCGLSQMIASRYGTVPVVRETGGLNDSIKAYTGDSGNGFTFKDYNAHDMLFVINEAVKAFHDKCVWQDILDRVFSADFSWNAQAGKYEELYSKLSK